MSEFFDDDHDRYEPIGEDEQQGIDRKYLWIFASVILFVGLLIFVIAESSKTTRVDDKDFLKYRRQQKAARTPGTVNREPVRSIESFRERDSSTPTPPPTIRSIDDSKLHLSVVRVFTERAFGSGTLLSRKGYFLTNAHVVHNSRFQLIFFSKNPRSSPEKYFLTEIAYENIRLDIAVLKVIQTYGNASLNHIVPVNIGNSSGLELGEELLIYGYPGIGGETITMTRGVISGFLDSPSWIKTDANISGGNSGGGAFNKQGEFIGVPTAKKIEQDLTSQIGMVRPINAIKSYINRFL